MTAFVILLAASTTFLILSGLAAFVIFLWQGSLPPQAPVADAPYPDDPSPSSGPGPDDPDPELDVWTEFDRQRDLAPVGDDRRSSVAVFEVRPADRDEARRLPSHVS